MVSRFSRRPFIKTTGTALQEKNFFTLGGLNLYTPDELSKDNESPYGRNFRIFQSDDLDARVSVSKRPGHTVKSNTGGISTEQSITSTTGAADKAVTTLIHRAQKFTNTDGVRFAGCTLNLKNDNTGTGPLIVQLYSDNSGVPGTLIATASIANTDITSTYAYVSARFIYRPALTATTDYWIVISQQSEGTGDYKISSTTSATTSLVSTDGGNTWATTTYALNSVAYVALYNPVSGIYRYYTSSANPVTLFAADGTLYSVNESTLALTAISTTLNASATDYRFVTVQDVVYFTNGYDAPKKWDGTTLSDIGGSPGISKDIVYHKERLFLLNTDGKIVYSEPGAYETYDAVAFVYAFPPKSAEQALRMTTFQDNIVCFARNAKSVIYGSDVSTMVRRESTASKGLASAKGLWKDTNYLYFLSDDGIFMYNGGTDEDMGIKIDRIFQDITAMDKAVLVVHDNKLRLYFTPSGSAENSQCLIYDMTHKAWMWDTNTYVSDAAVFNNQDDDNRLIVGSSQTAAIYQAEVGTADLSTPIEFDYYTKYFSFDYPAHKHRIKRLYTFFRPGTGAYYVTVGVDANENDSPSETQVYLGTDAATWGGGDTWGGGAEWGGTVLEPTRISVPGQARKHQIRFTQHGVDNPVEILGFTVMYSIRRPI